MTSDDVLLGPEFGSTRSQETARPVPCYSLSQYLRSGYHALWYQLSERLRWSRGVYREHPAGQLPRLSRGQAARVARLRRQFGVCFEAHCADLTALKNYDYLDVLDQAWTASGLARPLGGVVHDVGSSNFWYARALHAFFQPDVLIGVEVDSYRLYADGYSRWDYAQGYLDGLPGARFVAADYADYVKPADTVVAWYPFVTPAPLLAWRLPLTLFAPARLFARIAFNLKPGGVLVMANHGPEEAARAADLCQAAGLTFHSSSTVPVLLHARRVAPVLSIWTR